MDSERELQRFLGELSSTMLAVSTDLKDIKVEIAAINHRDQSRQIELVNIRNNLSNLPRLEVKIIELQEEYKNSKDDYRLLEGRIKLIESWQERISQSRKGFFTKLDGVIWQLLGMALTGLVVFGLTMFSNGIRVQLEGLRLQTPHPVTRPKD